MPGLLTREMAEEGLEMFDKIFQMLVKRDQVKRPHLHIVVMDPTKPHGCCSFENAILAKRTWGPVREFEYPFIPIARQKAEVTWRTGMPSRVVAQTAPHLLQHGNTKHGGSVIIDGMIVAASGCNWWEDVMLSGIAAHLILCRCNRRMQLEILPGEGDFIA